MSFSFRNIFTPEDGESGGGSAQEGGDSRHQGAFSPQNLGGNGGNGDIRSQSFQVSELLPFIPPAIAAREGIPMTKEVEIILPADGSNDVLLSTIYQVCPELFAAEITPLNESTVTLPAKLSNAPQPTPGASSPLSPGAAFSKPPGMSDSPALASQISPPASPGMEKANPFWSPDESEDAPEHQSQPVKDMSEQRSQQRPSHDVSEGKPTKGSGEIGNSPEKSVPPSPFTSGPPAGQSPETSAPGQDAVPNGFSGPAFGGANPFEQIPASENGAAASKEMPAPSSQFSGNPFESDEGYSTLFSTQAEEDSEIPFPSPLKKASPAPNEGSSQPESPPEGTWGSMFDAKAAPESGADVAAASANFESIGNLIPGKPPAGNEPGSAFDEDDDYGLFLPPQDEEHEVPAAFQTDSPSDELSKPENSNPPVKEEVNAPSIAFEPLAQSVNEGFSEVINKPVDQSSEEQPAAAPVKKPAVAEVTAVTGNSVSSQQLQPLVSEVPKAQSEFAQVVSAKPAEEIASGSQSKPNVSPATAGGVIPGLSASGEIQDLELRAIFSTNDSFTLRSVARRVVALPGIASCALATPGRLVQASRNEESRIGDEAKEMVDTIRNLAKLTGLPDAQSFTLHTNKGIVSLFLDGECCLTVHHESAEFEPGTREKLILVSRNLENLEK